MSRSRFMSLPLLLPPARWPGARPAALAPATPAPAAPSPAPAPAAERLGRPAGADDLACPGEPTRPASRRRPRIPLLRLGLTLEAGQAGALTEVVLARVLSCRRGVETVVLDLGPGADLDASTCEALHALHDRLRALSTRLWLVAAAGHTRERLRDSGLTHRLGSGAIHPSLRAAVLATYAAMPGPGLVTEDVRAALAAPAEPLRLLPPAEGMPPAHSPLPGGHTGQPASAGWRHTARPDSLASGVSTCPDRVHPPRVGRAAVRGWWTVLARITCRRGNTPWLT